MRTVLAIVRFIPGLIGASAAYLLSKLVFWATSFSVDLTLFLLTYLVVTVLIEAGFKRYGSMRNGR